MNMIFGFNSTRVDFFILSIFLGIKYCWQTYSPFILFILVLIMHIALSKKKNLFKLMKNMKILKLPVIRHQFTMIRSSPLMKWCEVETFHIL